ncbi:23S rRNA (adenine(1618)-N(6))-methyltransferase RlmF [Sansalvadorimonas verongulae]|uniref:23S rRNA (adenine(1618)-N(6))-methyltransferase RlmF n=1 Tax=Sansalvadorimonas verongulae TaxID=2172824 RepID=UPI0012BC8972|nr:23S rRNA (adenine(1618)-N(6))-methyltransferase RlmF [Sansalvadorimonas verongulae]MTI14022.1 23S rRNA (adenine(1618)-N(6))-methyltransferase RlmF [Sansalvadorimonas verongulae]
MSKKTTQLHPRNPHQGRYDLDALCTTLPALKTFIRTNPAGEKTVDFSSKQAVLHLNKALLAHHYQVTHWQIPEGYLCPPIPGRADMIHYLADLLAEEHDGKPPTGKGVRCLDIGTGANCIYPIIGARSYGWQFVASDIDPVSVKTAHLISQGNPGLDKLIRVVHQKSVKNIFHGIIKPTDRFDLTLCNPPFHSSLEEAQTGSLRKWNNLNAGKKKSSSKELKDKRNFGGQKTELWCEGGEVAFLKRMIKESEDFADQVHWFTSLVSKKDNLPTLKRILHTQKARQVRVIKMSQGQKTSHLLAWRYQ